MRLSQVLALPALFALGHAAAIDKTESKNDPVAKKYGDVDYDAVIVGGGPAGLSALSGLARVRRHVLLIDSGSYRNDPTRHMHDVIGVDGVTPAYYRWLARSKLAHYDTVEMTNGTVTKITPQQNNTFFKIESKGTKGGRNSVTARKIVLATGLKDILPNTPGIKENWGKGIFWCPWCDGHEHEDQPLGLLAPLDEVPGMVREMATLNRDVVAFVNGTDTPEERNKTNDKFPDWQTYLDVKKVKIENGTIEQLKRLKNGEPLHADASLPSVPEHDLFEVDLSGSKKPIERAAFFASFPSKQASDVGEKMGVKLLGGRLSADGTAGLSTNVPGAYAIGDANSDNVTNVPHALYSGKRTAVFLHVKLERENADLQIAAAKKDGADKVSAPEKREGDLDPRDVWERMNGSPGDVLYAGEFEQ